MIGSTHVANSILRKFKLNNELITPLRLHCLVYLLYSNCLYYEGVLFNETFVIDEGIPKVPNLSYKFDCYKNKVIESYALNAIEEVIFVKEKDDLFNYCLNNIINKYNGYSDFELLNFIKEEGNLISNYHNGEVIKICDILEDEINRNKSILDNAIKLRKKL